MLHVLENIKGKSSQEFLPFTQPILRSHFQKILQEIWQKLGSKMPRILFIFAIGALAFACTFQYSQAQDSEDNEDESGDTNPEDGEFFEGDIIMEDVEERAATGTVPYKSQLWPRNTLQYSVDLTFSNYQKNMISRAMQEIASKTCIRFKAGSTGNYARYTRTEKHGCSSKVGREGKGMQAINLANDCFTVGHGTVMHETLHALGLYHEQSRPDRDNFVRINKGNIANRIVGNGHKKHEGNFEKRPESKTQSVPYDYGSIMHYGADAFAKKGTRTLQNLKPLRNGVTMGQRSQLSNSDVLTLKRLYNCK